MGWVARGGRHGARKRTRALALGEPPAAPAATSRVNARRHGPVRRRRSPPSSSRHLGRAGPSRASVRIGVARIRARPRGRDRRPRPRHPRPGASRLHSRPPSPEPPSTCRALNATGAPNPTAAPPSGDDWHFFTHGYFRAPLRVGVGKRPACGAGQNPGTVINGVPCAGPGQSTTNLHSPFLPDDQQIRTGATRGKFWSKTGPRSFSTTATRGSSGPWAFEAYNLTDAGFNATRARSSGSPRGT